MAPTPTAPATRLLSAPNCRLAVLVIALFGAVFHGNGAAAQVRPGATAAPTGRLGPASETELRVRAAKALLDQGTALGKLGQRKQEIAAYDDVIRRFGISSEPGVRQQVAFALGRKFSALQKSGSSKEAIAVLDDTVRRFGAPNDALRMHAAMALRDKGDLLRELGQSEQAIATYGDLARWFDAANGLEISDEATAILPTAVAMALNSKAEMLEQLGRNEEATEVYADIVRRFEKVPLLFVDYIVPDAIAKAGRGRNIVPPQ